MTAVSDAIHGLGSAGDFGQQAQRFARHLEPAIVGVEFVEHHRRPCARIPGDILSACMGGRRLRSRNPSSPAKLSQRDHLHQLQLRHPEDRHWGQSRQRVVHEAELQLRIGRPGRA